MEEDDPSLGARPLSRSRRPRFARSALGECAVGAVGLLVLLRWGLIALGWLPHG